MRALGLTMMILLFMTSCGGQKCRDNAPEAQPVDIEIMRTEQELINSESLADVIAYFDKYPELATYFWHVDQYPSDTILSGRTFALINQQGVDTVFQESIAAYEDMTSVEEGLEEAFGRLKQLYPEAKTPKVMTAVSVFYNDFFISDSLIIIGLDHFIGPTAKYAPQDIPAYILARYDKAHLPAIIMQFLSGYYVKAGNKNTLLSDMIDFGKTYYMNSRLLPCTPDSIIMGYTPQNMIDIKENQEIIWANFIENQLLYETDHAIKRKFLSERPNVFEISQNCPGRIGAWVGWQIVESYMAKNEVSIVELMNNTDHHKIFEMSGYKPKDE
jgi:hypothetical protein